MNKHHPTYGALWMITAGLAFALVNSSSQYLSYGLGMHSTMVGLSQYGLSLLVMLPWILKTGLASALRTNRLGLHVFRVLMSVIGIQFWLWAMAWPIPIWQAIALLMTSPLFATAGSALFLKEHVGPARWLATSVGFMGSLIILEPWSSDFSLASLLPVVAALFWAAYSVTVKHMSDTESPGSIVVYLLLLIAPFNLFLALPNLAMPTQEMWPVLILSGFLVALGQWSIAKAYANAEASFVQPFDLLKLPLNLLAAWIVFDQVPGGSLWSGAGLIVGATLFILHRERKLHTRVTTTS